MNLLNLNIYLPHLKFLILFGFLFAVISIILWVVISYYVFKWCKTNIDENYIYFNEYSDKSKKILEKYGNYPIRNIYLVRQPITKLAIFFINLITFYNFDKELNKFNKNKNNIIFPNHSSLIFEIEMFDKKRKKILIEKNNCIKIDTNFKIYDEQDMLKIAFKNKKQTIANILNITQERVGNNKFFNWHICHNNCQMLTKELLITLKKFNKKNKSFMYQDDINNINFSEFTLHIINSITNLYNMIETMLGVSLYF